MKYETKENNREHIRWCIECKKCEEIAKWTKGAINTGKLHRELLAIQTLDVKSLRHKAL